MVQEKFALTDTRAEVRSGLPLNAIYCSDGLQRCCDRVMSETSVCLPTVCRSPYQLAAKMNETLLNVLMQRTFYMDT